MSAYEMEWSLGEITKRIQKTEDNVKNQGRRTRKHVKNDNAVYAVEQLIREVEANEKALAERLASITRLVRIMAAQMTGLVREVEGLPGHVNRDCRHHQALEKVESRLKALESRPSSSPTPSPPLEGMRR